MKPNGRKFVLRAVLVTCTIALLSALGSAEVVRGSFKLPVEARWGGMVLAPGTYEFTADTRSNGSIVFLRSSDARLSGMIMSASSSDLRRDVGSGLKLGNVEGMAYVKTLYLSDLDLQLNFGAPKIIRSGKLTPSHTTAVASASGTH